MCTCNLTLPGENKDMRRRCDENRRQMECFRSFHQTMMVWVGHGLHQLLGQHLCNMAVWSRLIEFFRSAWSEMMSLIFGCSVLQIHCHLSHMFYLSLRFHHADFPAAYEIPVLIQLSDFARCTLIHTNCLSNTGIHILLLWYTIMFSFSFYALWSPFPGSAWCASWTQMA